MSDKRMEAKTLCYISHGPVRKFDPTISSQDQLVLHYLLQITNTPNWTIEMILEIYMIHIGILGIGSTLSG